MPAPIQLGNYERSRLRARLLAWYDRHRRDLPWRKTRDPYAIWVSEIMLQQTRVAAVVERYAAFLLRFPDVAALARADVSEVLALWSGLGYYRRARAIHAAAREVVARGGAMPSDAEGWRALPGIGRYTAAAIASIAFGEPVAVVDGNVERVLRRITGDAGLPIGAIWQLASDCLSQRRPGDFNQAMMELGATVCLPGAPRCDACPLRSLCATRGELPSGPAPRRLQRDSAYALDLRRGMVYLKRRDAKASLMPGMWELPEITPNGHVAEFTLRHAITVTDYRVSVFRIRHGCRGGEWFPPEEAARLPLTGLARKILRRAGII